MSETEYAAKMALKMQARMARSEAFWGGDPLIRALYPLTLPPHPSDEYEDWKHNEARRAQSRARRAG